MGISFPQPGGVEGFIGGIHHPDKIFAMFGGRWI
jgi:hypothetical protein